jgi:hypothetical protein
MQRLDTNFSQAASPLDLPGQDPGINTTTSIANSTTLDLGNGVLQRTINLTAVAGTITLKETPLGGTLVVYQGTVVLSAPGCSVSGNAITFPTPLTGITLSYQTSAYARPPASWLASGIHEAALSCNVTWS